MPNSEIFKDQITIDRRGYIPTSDIMETNVPGVFACGDIRDKWLRQVATAVGDGAVAACAAEKYIAEEEHYNTLIVKPEKPVAVLVYNAVEKESQNCLLMFKDIEEAFGDACAYVRLDVYKSGGMAKRLGVSTVPAFVLVKEGRIIDMCCSDISTGAMKTMLRNHLG